MKKNLCLFLLLILNYEVVLSQDNKENPIIYLDVLLGGGGNQEVSGINFGTSINYQSNTNLFTYRMQYVSEKKEDPNFLEAILVIPYFLGGDSLNEYALLYGKRFIFNGHALSVSAGLSTNLIKYSKTDNDDIVLKRDNYLAIPFEINFHFFKTIKRRYRMFYRLISIGKSTGFGRSIGVKLYGSFGKFNYVGLGLNFGLGWHKVY
ncbi:hypothetical protein [Winogradskyella immobilis]|uniref:Outer membrane protein beta-barrel domain-containing protein n=1 Tax=Winogradskyella immobilis TaxID=2816852 RepID=A0ABS8ERD7_9FLAO|nr:hypothetical protein [Winogradskyella immobilis]MCC1485456.1 hypothetical protein [Winogradskyella immobilis]MCG0017548.1 hypothetical protein [Winogradskyella immobilis]